MPQRIRRRAFLHAATRGALASALLPVHALVSPSCATTGLAPGRAAEVARHRMLGRPLGAPLMLSADPELLPNEVAWIPEQLPESAERVRAFGLVQRHACEIRAYATQARFLRALPAPAPWLRAWASDSVIHISPRRHWRTDSEEEATERLAHELAHVCVFQGFRDAAHARAGQMPFWWLEGVPSVVAGQDARRMPMHEVAQWLASPTTGAIPRAWRAWPHEIAYGAAHHLVRALVDREGKAVLARVLARATQDGVAPGCIERALRAECDLDEERLWELARQHH